MSIHRSAVNQTKRQFSKIKTLENQKNVAHKNYVMKYSCLDWCPHAVTKHVVHYYCATRSCSVASYVDA